MSLLLKICGGAIIAAVCSSVIRQSKGSAFSVVLIGSAVIFGAVMPGIMEMFSSLVSPLADKDMDIYASVMLKSLGIGMTVKVSSDVCRELGSEALAGGIELAGKAQILLICLPIVTSLTNIIREVM